MERFAPGFRECVLARQVLRPSDLESMDANLIGGDIAGGESDWRQFILRPTWRDYATSAKDIYICSSSTPPGAGVHGMCGYNAAKLALRQGSTSPGFTAMSHTRHLWICFLESKLRWSASLHDFVTASSRGAYCDPAI